AICFIFPRPVYARLGHRGSRGWAAGRVLVPLLGSSLFTISPLLDPRDKPGVALPRCSIHAHQVSIPARSPSRPASVGDCWCGRTPCGCLCCGPSANSGHRKQTMDAPIGSALAPTVSLQSCQAFSCARIHRVYLLKATPSAHKDDLATGRVSCSSAIATETQ